MTTDKEMREAFESVYFQAHQYRKTLAGINGYCSEYHEIYEGFQAAYQLQQKRIEELEAVLEKLKSCLKNGLLEHDINHFEKTIRAAVYITEQALTKDKS